MYPCLPRVGCLVSDGLFRSQNGRTGIEMPLEITVKELQKKQKSNERPVLLDVRESEEVALVTLPNAIHIPMGEIPARLDELDPASEIVVYCHHGVRSLQVVQFLRQNDYPHTVSLTGGIDAWAVEVEQGLARY